MLKKWEESRKTHPQIEKESQKSGKKVHAVQRKREICVNKTQKVQERYCAKITMIQSIKHGGK